MLAVHAEAVWLVSELEQGRWDQPDTVTSPAHGTGYRFPMSTYTFAGVYSLSTK